MAMPLQAPFRPPLQEGQYVVKVAEPITPWIELQATLATLWAWLMEPRKGGRTYAECFFAELTNRIEYRTEVRQAEYTPYACRWEPPSRSPFYTQTLVEERLFENGAVMASRRRYLDL